MAGTQRPNYFIGVQITNPQVLQNIAAMQDVVSNQELSPPWQGLKDTQIFSDSFIRPVKMHFTLNLMHLKGEADVKRAQQILAEVGSLVQNDMVKNPVTMTIEGLGHFGRNVVFAKIKEDAAVNRLVALHSLFQETFHERLHLPLERRPFQPHLTVAKISQSRKCRGNGISSFPPNMWAAYENAKFGEDVVNGLQLLKMGSSDPITKYYVKCGEFNFF